MRLESTVLSDLSANVFAALLLILLILLQADAQPDVVTPPPREPHPVEATTELHSRLRVPMGSRDLVAFLYDRRPGADGLSLDLTEGGIAGGQSGRPVVDLLSGTDPGQPIRLYVFSQARYEAVTDVLAQAGRRWQEVSVPRALRDPTTGGWSRDFLALLDRRPERSRFRDDLARLLAAAPGPLVPDGGVSAGGGSSRSGMGTPSALGEPLLDRLLRWLGAVLGIVALLSGVATVAAIEMLVPRAQPRYSAPGFRADGEPGTSRHG